MSQKIFKNNKGISILEILLGLGMFAIIASAVSSLAIGGLRSLIRAERYIDATSIAQEGVEAVRFVRDVAWNDLIYTQSAVEATSSRWILSGEGTTEQIGNFSRIINFDDVCRNIDDDIADCPASYTDPHSKKVTVDVEWEVIKDFKTTSFQYLTYLTNWKSRDWTQTDWSGGDGQIFFINQTRFISEDGNINFTTPGEIKLNTIPLGEWVIDSDFARDIRGVSALASNDIWAVGDSGKIYNYDGVSWSEFDDLGGSAIFAIDMVSATDGWAVGASSRIYHYDGNDWTQYVDLGGAAIRAIDMVSATDGWAAGNSGRLYHYDGVSWSQSVDLGGQLFRAIDMVSATDGWAVGNAGLIYHYDGASWSQFVDTGGMDWYAIDMISSLDGWLVGEGGQIYHYDGASWSQFVDTGGMNWYAINMLSANKGWAVGDGGEIYIYNNNEWASFPSPTGDNIYAIAAISEFDCWALGENGTILRNETGGLGAEESGILTSSAFNMWNSSPVQVVEWDEYIPPECSPVEDCSVKLQIRVSPFIFPIVWTDWYGADGAGTYFTKSTGELVPNELNWNQWVQYRVTLNSDEVETPIVYEIRVNYK